MFLSFNLFGLTAIWHAHCEGENQGLIDIDERISAPSEDTLNPGGEK